MKISKTVSVAAVVAVQLAALGWIIGRFERVVRTGTEVRFACRAYDPYDPLRGRYLRMRVEENCSYAEGFKPDSWRFGAFVRIDPTGGTNGLSRVVACAGEPGAEGLWVRLEDLRQYGDTAQVTFPDQFFMNERLAPEAEKILRDRTASAVAVYRATSAGMVLTDVEIDGVSIAELARKGE